MAQDAIFRQSDPGARADNSDLTAAPRPVDPVEFASMKVNLDQQAHRIRLLEKQMDVMVMTPWWKRIVFAIDGWPWHRWADHPQWRPWHRWGRLTK